MTKNAPETIRILVIDDEAGVLSLLKTLLSRAGYQVLTTSSADEALALFEKGRFDCVITDAVMPEVSGYDLVKSIRTNPRHAHLPILMLTRKRHRQDVKRAVEAGVTDYIFKPIDEALLLEKVEACARGPARAESGERRLDPAAGRGEIGIDCAVVALGETSLTISAPIKFERNQAVTLRCELFQELGLPGPARQAELAALKVEQSRKDGTAADRWETQLSLSGIPEEAASKLRAWLRRTAGR